jgi:hypothetical protein
LFGAIFDDLNVVRFSIAVAVSLCVATFALEDANATQSHKSNQDQTKGEFDRKRAKSIQF